MFTADSLAIIAASRQLERCRDADDPQRRVAETDPTLVGCEINAVPGLRALLHRSSARGLLLLTPHDLELGGAVSAFETELRDSIHRRGLRLAETTT